MFDFWWTEIGDEDEECRVYVILFYHSLCFSVELLGSSMVLSVVTLLWEEDGGDERWGEETKCGLWKATRAASLDPFEWFVLWLF